MDGYRHGHFILCCLFILGCAREPRPAPGPATTPAASVDTRTREQLRDQARLVLERHCGECHIAAYTTALPRALRVYDLGRLEWAAQMTDAQLRQLDSRIEGGALFDEFDTRNKGRSPPPPPSATDKATVRSYVRAELEARLRQHPAASTPNCS